MRVELGAVAGAGLAERVHEAAPRPVVEAAVERARVRSQTRVDGVEEGAHLAGERDGRAVGQERLQVDDGAVEVRGRHDREPLADERVVRVVPLRALGVHPDPALGHQVGQLDEQQQEQLLGHRDVHDRAVRALEQAGVGALARGRGGDALVELRVEGDGVVRVVEHGRVGRDPVGNVRVAEDAALQQVGQRAGIEARRDLQELLQVDDLVVAPVADVGPRVALVRHLPLDAVAGDPVRVVAVRRGRAQEDADHPVRRTPGRRTPGPPSSGRCRASCPGSRAAADRPGGGR